MGLGRAQGFRLGLGLGWASGGLGVGLVVFAWGAFRVGARGLNFGLILGPASASEIQRSQVRAARWTRSAGLSSLRPARTQKGFAWNRRGCVLGGLRANFFGLLRVCYGSP